MPIFPIPQPDQSISANARSLRVLNLANLSASVGASSVPFTIVHSPSRTRTMRY